jgi:hypothetical protein
MVYSNQIKSLIAVSLLIEHCSLLKMHILQKGIAVGLGLSKSGEEKDIECLNSNSPLEFNTWNIPKLRKKAILFQKY